MGLTRAILALALRARYARPKSLQAILSNPRTPFGMLLTFQASAFDHSATSPRGRKGTGGDPSDQIYGGAEPEGSWTGGTEGWAGAGGAVRISLAALLGGAGL